VYRSGHLVFSALKPKPGDRRNIELLPGKNGRLPLRRVLQRLAKLGVVHLLVEGGAEVLTQFIEAELWDELKLFVAPKLAGPKGIPWFQGRSAARMRDSMELGSFSVHRSFSPDIAVFIERHRRRPL
jgi:diaminohydroxyphosphoribosylaminopyrimidine deaminase/5-amino-6-(5-phosphoribosylamino)uracil reductase